MSDHARKTALLGETLRQEGNYSKAIECFTKAIQENSKYWWAYAHRGSARAALGDYLGAVEDFYKDEVIQYYKAQNEAWFLAQKGELYRLWAMAATSAIDLTDAANNEHVKAELEHQTVSWHTLSERAIILFTQALGDSQPRNPWILAHRGAAYTMRYWIRADMYRALPDKALSSASIFESMNLDVMSRYVKSIEVMSHGIAPGVTYRVNNKDANDAKDAEYHCAHDDFSEALDLNPNYGWVYLFRAILLATRAYYDQTGAGDGAAGMDTDRRAAACDIGMAQMSGLNREQSMLRAMMEMSVYAGGELALASRTNSSLKKRAATVLHEGVRLAWQTLQIDCDETFARYFVANGLAQLELLDRGAATSTTPGRGLDKDAVQDPTVKAAIHRARVALGGMEARILALRGGLDCLEGKRKDAEDKLQKIRESMDLEALTIVSRDPAWAPLRDSNGPMSARATQISIKRPIPKNPPIPVSPVMDIKPPIDIMPHVAVTPQIDMKPR